MIALWLVDYWKLEHQFICAINVNYNNVKILYAEHLEYFKTWSTISKWNRCLSLVSSALEDDLSQERSSWQEQSSTPENQGKIEMLHSQRFRGLHLLVVGDFFFSHQQSSLECQAAFTFDSHILTCWNRRMWLLNSSSRVHFLFIM